MVMAIAVCSASLRGQLPRAQPRAQRDDGDEQDEEDDDAEQGRAEVAQRRRHDGEADVAGERRQQAEHADRARCT